VTSIEGTAFSGCDNLTSVTLDSEALVSSESLPEELSIYIYPTPLKSIFGNQVKEYILGSSISYIGHFAFCGCSGMTSLTIPSSVTSIGCEAFDGCSSLTSVNINDLAAWCKMGFFNSESNPLYYAHHLYLNGEEIKDLVIPDGVTNIGEYVFRDCSSLTSITIPSSVTRIGYGAFYGCCLQKDSFVNNSSLTNSTNWGAVLFDMETSDGLFINDMVVIGCRPWVTSVIIPDGVTGISERVFSGCSRLTSVTIGNSVTSIGWYAFSGCSSLTSVTIGNSVTNICGCAFCDCNSLASISIPSSVTNIDGSAFRDCSSLASVTFGNSVTSIGSEAFKGCTSLASITIPSSVTSIGNNAFSGCKLRNVLVKCTTPPSGGSAFSEQTLYHTTLYVPTGCWDAYAYDGIWYRFINIRETATSEEQVSEQQVYTMMDANTFAYSVYDPVNDCIGTLNSVGGINEDNPNHCWQVIDAGSSRYLYNLGAKKFLGKAGNRLTLTDMPEPIEMEDGNNGIIFGEQRASQWALVSNVRMIINQSVLDEVTALGNISSKKQGNSNIYNLSGQQMTMPQKGINLVNGRKVLVR